MNTLVIARYSEDLDWVVDVPDDFQVVIYNKGEEITSEAVIAKASKIIDRPNIGRESESYTYHMLNNSFADNSFTAFAQGDPISHSPDFIKLLKNWRNWDEVQALAWQYKEDKDVPPKVILYNYQNYFPDRLRVRAELFSLYNWGENQTMDGLALTMGSVYKFIQNISMETTNIAAHVLRRWKLHHLADDAEQHSVGIFSYGALFAVRNRRIRNISDESKQLIHDFAAEDVSAHGYILERMWLHIFGEKFIRRLAPLNTYPD